MPRSANAAFSLFFARRRFFVLVIMERVCCRLKSDKVNDNALAGLECHVVSVADRANRAARQDKLLIVDVMVHKISKSARNAEKEEGRSIKRGPFMELFDFSKKRVSPQSAQKSRVLIHVENWNGMEWIFQWKRSNSRWNGMEIFHARAHA
jgi:hypothetical protein